MSIKSILFNTEMVRAILDGKKTVTRRIVKPANPFHPEKYKQMDGLCVDGYKKDCEEPNGHIKDYSVSNCWWSKKRYIERYGKYKPGDILYVRETWQLDPNGFDGIPPEYWWVYKATDELPETCAKWRPSIHMPRKATRIWLKVTNVRVEQLQDITEEQAIAEGTPYDLCGGWRPTFNDPDSGGDDPDFILGYSKLWNSIAKEDWQKWESNPWVWVIDFERCEKPEV